MRNNPVAIAAVVGAAVAAFAVWGYRPAVSSARVTRAVITLPAGIVFSTKPAQFAVSPDGSQIAMNLTASDGTRVWVWRLGGVDSRPLAGTEGVTSVPAWSPDSQHLAFVADGTLRRIPAVGGPVQVICALAADATVDWGADGTLLLAAGGSEPIRRVAADAGDTVRQITRLYPDEQHEFPKFVPGARRFLFFVQADALREGVWAGSFDGGMARRILPHATSAVVANDFVVYSLDGLIVAQHFNRDTLELSDVPTTLADHVAHAEPSARPAFSVSPAPHPLLVFQTDSEDTLRMTHEWPSLVASK